MFKFVKTILSGAHEKQVFIKVEPVDFKDGLLRLKTDDQIPLTKQTVLSSSPSGTIEVVLDVRSYDEENRLYLAEVPETEAQLEDLGISIAESTRVIRVLEVAGPMLPDARGFTEDISVGGMRLCTSEVLESGSLQDLSIILDNKARTEIIVRAKVTWSAHQGTGACHSGLRFQDVDAKTLCTLIRFIRARRK